MPPVLSSHFPPCVLTRIPWKVLTRSSEETPRHRAPIFSLRSRFFFFFFQKSLLCGKLKTCSWVSWRRRTSVKTYCECFWCVAFAKTSGVHAGREESGAALARRALGIALGFFFFFFFFGGGTTCALFNIPLQQNSGASRGIGSRFWNHLVFCLFVLLQQREAARADVFKLLRSDRQDRCQRPALSLKKTNNNNNKNTPPTSPDSDWNPTRFKGWQRLKVFVFTLPRNFPVLVAVSLLSTERYSSLTLTRAPLRFLSACEVDKFYSKVSLYTFTHPITLCLQTASHPSHLSFSCLNFSVFVPVNFWPPCSLGICSSLTFSWGQGNRPLKNA